MAALRSPADGCPWDLDQDFSSIAPYTVEEAYEVADAIEREAFDELPGELGDLLFQVVFHARLGEEAGLFDFAAVTAAICRKLTERHPHVFAGADFADSAARAADWERRKATERAARGTTGVLGGIPGGLPALTRARKLGGRAARVGFDWPDVAGVRAKLTEELAELDEALGAADPAATREELGDLLFAIANLCRHLEVDPEQALRGANRKFARRFGYLEQQVAAHGGEWAALAPAQLEAWWAAAKASERADPTDE